MRPQSLMFTSEQQLSATLKRGSIYHIEGTGVYPESDGRPHFFIVLNYDPMPGHVLVLTHGTRQVQRAVEKAINNNSSQSTVVVIPPGKYKIFQEQTAIDCNDIAVLPFAKLVEIMDSGELRIVSTELDSKDLSKIIQGVLDSNMIDEVKKAPLRFSPQAA